MKLVANMTSMNKTFDQDGIKVFTTFEGAMMSSVVEVAMVEGLTPMEDFNFFIENWPICAHKVNPLIIELKELEPVDGVSVAYTIAKCPAPLSNRINFAARYVRYDREPGEILFLMSERGAESRITTVDKDLVKAQLFIAGWQFIPVEDACGEVIGTKIFYLQSADAGGNIPSFVQNMAGPNQSKQVV